MALDSIELPTSEVEALNNILKIVSNVGIDNILIESDHESSILSGVNGDNSIILFCHHELPSVLSCMNLVLPNIKMVLARIKSLKDYQCYIKVDDESLEVEQMEFLTQDGKVVIPCLNFESNKKHFPRMQVDPSTVFSVYKTKEQLTFLNEQLKSFGQKGRKAGKLSFYNEDGLSMSFDDGENNSYVESLSIDEEIEVSYPLTSIYTLFRESHRVEKELNAFVMDSDFLQITIDNITLHVVPSVE